MEKKRLRVQKQRGDIKEQEPRNGKTDRVQGMTGEGETKQEVRRYLY